MTNEYKQIDMTIEDYTTRDFKRGFKLAKEKNATEITFSWGVKMRTPDVSFVQRIRNVWGTMTNTDADDYIFRVNVAHTLTVTRADGAPLFS